MLDEVVLGGIKIPGVNAPVRTKEDSIKELAQVAEKERQAMIGKAFEGLLKNLYTGKGDFSDMLTASTKMREALGLMRLDGRPMTGEELNRAMFDLTRMQLDVLAQQPNPYFDLRKGWREFPKIGPEKTAGLDSGGVDVLLQQIKKQIPKPKRVIPVDFGRKATQ